MASFRIHEDRENAALGHRKENADAVFSAAQRRALGDLSQFTCNQNRSLKLVSMYLFMFVKARSKCVWSYLWLPDLQPGLTNGPCKVQDEIRTVRQIKNEKNIVPPVAQFRAFSVYEDKPSEAEAKKRESTFKPFVSKELTKENFFVSAADNVRALCVKVEKQPEVQKEAPSVRWVIITHGMVERALLCNSTMLRLCCVHCTLCDI